MEKQTFQFCKDIQYQKWIKSGSNSLLCQNQDWQSGSPPPSNPNLSSQRNNNFLTLRLQDNAEHQLKGLDMVNERPGKTTWVSEQMFKEGVHHFELFHPFKLKKVEIGLIKESKNSSKSEIFMQVNLSCKSVLVKVNFEKNKLQVIQKEKKSMTEISFTKGKYRLAFRLKNIGNCISVNPFVIEENFSEAKCENQKYAEKVFGNVFKSWKLIQDFDFESAPLKTKLKPIMELAAEEEKVEEEEVNEKKTNQEMKCPKLEMLNKLINIPNNKFLTVKDFIYDEESKILAVKTEPTFFKMLSKLNTHIKFATDKKQFIKKMKQVMMRRQLQSSSNLAEITQPIVNFLDKNFDKLVKPLENKEQFLISIQKFKSKLDQDQISTTNSDSENCTQNWMLPSKNLLILSKKMMKVLLPVNSKNKENPEYNLNPFLMSNYSFDDVFGELTVLELNLLLKNIKWEMVFLNYLFENKQSENFASFFDILLKQSQIRNGILYFKIPKQIISDFLLILSEYLSQSFLMKSLISIRGDQCMRKMTTEYESYNKIEGDNSNSDNLSSENNNNNNKSEEDFGLINLFDVTSPSKLKSNDSKKKDEELNLEDKNSSSKFKRKITPSYLDLIYSKNINRTSVPSQIDALQSIIAKLEEIVHIQKNFINDFRPQEKTKDSDLEQESSKLCRPNSAFSRLFSYINSNVEKQDLKKLVEYGFVSNTGFRTDNKHFLNFTNSIPNQNLATEDKITDMIQRNNGMNRHLDGLPNENIPLSLSVNSLPPCILPNEILKVDVMNSKDLIATIDKDFNLCVWGSKYGLVKLFEQDLKEKQDIRQLDKLINYSIEKEKVDDNDFYGLNGENSRISFAKPPVDKGTAAALNKPAENSINNQAEKKVENPKDLALKQKKMEDMKEMIADQLYQMGFDLKKIKKALVNCKQEELTPDIIIGKIFELKDEEVPKIVKSKSKLILAPEWNCTACTFLNVTENNLDSPELCSICFSPAPDDAYLTEVFIDEMEQNDELLYKQLDQSEKMNEYPSSLQIEHGFLSTVLKAGDKILTLNLNEFTKENLLNRFVISINFLRDKVTYTMLVRIGYQKDFLQKLLFLNKYENKVTTYLGHSYLPKGEEEQYLGSILSNDFVEQVHQILPFTQASPVLSQSGRLVFKRETDLSSAQTANLNKCKNSNQSLVSKQITTQKLTAETLVSESNIKINCCFASEKDSIGLFSIENNQRTLKMVSVVNQAASYFYSDMQVEVSFQIEFPSALSFLKSDDPKEILITCENSLWRLNYQELQLDLVSRLAENEIKFVEKISSNLILQDSNKALTVKSLSINQSKLISSSEISQKDQKKEIISLFKNPSELLEFFKNTKSIKYLNKSSENVLSYNFGKDANESCYYQLINNKSASSITLSLLESQKAIISELELFVNISQSSTPELFSKIVSHFSDKKFDLPKFSSSIPNPNIVNKSQNRLAVKNIQSLGGTYSSKHFVSQMFSDDNESFLSSQQNSVLIFESVYDKRMKINKLLIQCPKVWEKGNSPETALIVMFEDLALVSILSKLRSLTDEEILQLCNKLGLLHKFLKIEAGNPNFFLLEKELQGRYFAFVPLKYKSLDRSLSSQLVISRLFLYGALTNSKDLTRSMNIVDDNILKFKSKDLFSVSMNYNNEEMNLEEELDIYIEGYEQISQNNLTVFARIQHQSNSSLIQDVKVNLKNFAKDVSIIGLRPKFFSEKNPSILKTKNDFLESKFDSLRTALQTHKEDMMRPDLLIDSITLIKFLIDSFNSKIADVFLEIFDLKDFILKHLLGDFSIQRISSVMNFLSSLINPSSKEQFIKSIKQILLDLQNCYFTKEGFNLFFEFIEKKLVCHEALEKEDKKELLSLFIDYMSTSLENIARLDNSFSRMMQNFDSCQNDHEFIDLLQIQVSNDTSVETKQTSDNKQSDTIQTSNFKSFLDVDTILCRNDSLTNGVLALRKFDNVQEYLFLSENLVNLKQVWIKMKEYNGPCFNFDLALEIFDPVQNNFINILQKHYENGFVHNAIVQKGISFGVQIPDSTENLSQLFRITITLNSLASVSYIQGLDIINFEMEFGTNTNKEQNRICIVCEGKFEDLKNNFVKSKDKNYSNHFEVIEKKQNQNIISNPKNLKVVEKEQNKKDEQESNVNIDKQASVGCVISQTQTLNNIRTEIKKAFAEMETDTQGLEKTRVIITEKLKSISDCYSTFDRQVEKISTAAIQTTNNMNFWLKVFTQMDQFVHSFKDSWTLEDKTEEYLNKLFEKMLMNVLVPEYKSSAKIFDSLSLRISAETKREIFAKCLEECIQKTDDKSFMLKYEEYSKRISNLLKVKSLFEWNDIKSRLEEVFSSENPQSDHNIKKCLIFSVLFDEFLSDLPVENLYDSNLINENLRMINSILENGLHKLNEYFLKNLISFAKFTLKSLTQENISEIEISVLKKCITLFVRQNLTNKIETIFSIVINCFAKKQMTEFFYFLNTIFERIIREEFLEKATTKSVFDTNDNNLLSFCLRNCLSIHKNINNIKKLNKKKENEENLQTMKKQKTLKRVSSKEVDSSIKKKSQEEFSSELAFSVQIFKHVCQMGNLSLIQEEILKSIMFLILVDPQSNKEIHRNLLANILEENSKNELLNEVTCRTFTNSVKQHFSNIKSKEELNQTVKFVIDLLNQIVSSQFLGSKLNKLMINFLTEITDQLISFKDNKKTSGETLSVNIVAKDAWNIFANVVNLLEEHFHRGTGESFKEMDCASLNLFCLVSNMLVILTEKTDSQNEKLTVVMMNQLKSVDKVFIQNLASKLVRWKLFNGHLKGFKFKSASGIIYLRISKNLDLFYGAMLKNQELSKVMTKTLIQLLKNLFESLLKSDRKNEVDMVTCYYLDNAKSLFLIHSEIICKDDSVAQNFIEEYEGLEFVMEMLDKTLENENHRQREINQFSTSKQNQFFRKLMLKKIEEEKKDLNNKEQKKEVSWEKDLAILEEEFGKQIQFKQIDFGITNGSNILDWQNNKTGRINQVYTATFPYNRKEIKLLYKMKKEINLKLFKVAFNISKLDQQYPVGIPSYVRLIINYKDKNENCHRKDLGLLSYIEDSGFLNYNVRVYYFNPFNLTSDVSDIAYAANFSEFELVIGKPDSSYYDNQSPYLNKRPFEMNQVMINFISIQGCDSSKIDFPFYLNSSLKKCFYEFLGNLFNAKCLNHLLSDYLDSQRLKNEEGIFSMVTKHIDVFMKEFTLEMSNFILTVASKKKDMSQLIFSFLLKNLDSKPEFYSLVQKMLTSGSLDFKFLFDFWQFGKENMIKDANFGDKFLEVFCNTLRYHMSTYGKIVFDLQMEDVKLILNKYSDLKFNYNIERVFMLLTYAMDQNQFVKEFDQSSLLEEMNTKELEQQKVYLLNLQQNQSVESLTKLKTEIIELLIRSNEPKSDISSLILLGLISLNVKEAETLILSNKIIQKVSEMMASNSHLLECLLFLNNLFNNCNLAKELRNQKIDELLLSFVEKAFEKKIEKNNNENEKKVEWRVVFNDNRVLKLLLKNLFEFIKHDVALIEAFETKIFNLLKINKTNSFFVGNILLELFNFQKYSQVSFDFDPSLKTSMTKSLIKLPTIKQSKGEIFADESIMKFDKQSTLATSLKLLVDEKMEKTIRNSSWKKVIHVQSDPEDFSELVKEHLFNSNPFLMVIRLDKGPQDNYVGVFCPQGFVKENEEKGYIPCSDNCFLFYYSNDSEQIVAHYSQEQFSENEKFLVFENTDSYKSITLTCKGSENIYISMDEDNQSLIDLYPMKCLSSDPNPNMEYPYEESISSVEFYQIELLDNNSTDKNSFWIERMTSEQKAQNCVNWVKSALKDNYVFNVPEEMILEKFCSQFGIEVPEKINGLEVDKKSAKIKEFGKENPVIVIPSYKEVNFVQSKVFKDNYTPFFPVFEIFRQRGGIRFILQTIIDNPKIEFFADKQIIFDNLKNNFRYILELESLEGFSGSLAQNQEFLPAVFELFIAKESNRNWEDFNMSLSALIFGRLALLLKNTNDSAVRENFLKLKVHEKLLQKLAELTNDISRVFLSQEELNKKFETNEEDIKETKEEEQNFKKEIKKRKGVGYDKEGSGQKWLINEYLEKKKKKNAIIVELLRLFCNLFDVKYSQPDKVIDKTSGIYRIVAESCMLPMLESAFKCSSMVEMAKDFDLYIEYCNVVKLFSKNGELKPLMNKLPNNYQPPQINSLLSILKKQEENTALFRKIASEKDKNKSQQTEEKESDKSLEFTKVITEMIDQIKLEFDNFGQNEEEQERIDKLLKNFDILSVNEKYKLVNEGKQFGVCDFKSTEGKKKFTHHYDDTITRDNKTMQGSQVVRLAQEIADLTASLPRDSYNAIFVRADETRLDVIKAMIAGAESTPYANGLFEYHIYLPNNYPTGPPKCNLETTGSGDVRFNPNLYSCGKVCLSLLGTWRGNASENWDPKISNLLQLFLSIQAVVMSEEVYFNEPGYEGEAGTVEGEKKNEGYSNVVRLCNIKYGMLQHLESPVKGFEQITRTHFLLKKDVILKEVGTWVKMAEQREASYNGLVMDHNSKYCQRFKQDKNLYLKELKEQIVKLEGALKELSSTFDIRSIFTKKSKTKKKKEISKEEEQKIQERKEKLKKEQQKNLENMMQQIDVDFEDDVNVKREFNADDATVTDRWSRYIGAMGIEAVKKQSQAQVMLVGVNSLGIEVAKNLTLGGLKKLVLCDWKSFDTTDSVGNFFAQGEEGKNRAEAVLSKLGQLNFYVQLEAQKIQVEMKDEEIENMLKGINVLVLCEHFAPLTNRLIEKAKSLSNIKIISGEIVGVHLRVFVDLGKKFTVNDKDGEEPVDLFVENIMNDGTVTLVKGSKHNLMEGDFFTLNEVVEVKSENESSLKSLNKSLQQIKSMDTNLKFKVENFNSEEYRKYESGGKIKQMKVPFKMEFKETNVIQNGEDPEKMFWDENLLIHDFEKMCSSKLVASCFVIKERAELKNGKELSELSFKTVKEVLTETELKNEDLMKRLRLFTANSYGEMPSISAFLGGLLSQEIVKSITNKFTPIKQLFCSDFIEVLDERFLEDIDSVLKEDEVKTFDKSKEDKYSRLRFLLGEESFEKIINAKLFMVGAGAIGCELLKNYAMVGLGSAKQGRIIMTDPDSIELSNLNRQFLFREKHIGKPKSLVAAKVVEMMNPDYKTVFEGEKGSEVISLESGSRIMARLEKVSPLTEDTFDENFFKSLSICTNALDNIKARVYMDQQCVKSERPLVESGTLGPKGHVQVIVPHVTENYGQVQDANEEGAIPICTLKMFPEETIHCVEWAKDRFDFLFNQRVKSLQRVVEEYIKNKNLSEGIEKKIVKEALKLFKKRPLNIRDCIVEGRKAFQKYFYNKIKQLMYVYPIDKLTKEGKPFWSLPKRPPTEIKFDPSVKMHEVFVKTYARLTARIWGMDDKEIKNADLASELENIKIKPFVPSDEKAKEIEKENEEKDKKEEQEDNQEQENQKEEEEDNIKLIKELEDEFKLSSDLNNLLKLLTPEIFEKDEDSNGHIDFIASCGNLRAFNYKLEEMDWIKVKLKAGRIVPALATTTAAVAGLQTIEVIKTLKGLKLEKYRNCFLNLAINILQLSEPGPVSKNKIHEDLIVTVWDKWQFEFDSVNKISHKFSDFVNGIQEKYKIKVKDVLNGNTPLFLSALHKFDDFKDKQLEEMLEIERGKSVSLTINCCKKEEEDKNLDGIPPVIVRNVDLKKSK